MSLLAIQSTKRVLEPFDRVSEVLFGLIMVLTITGSLSVAKSGKHELQTMLAGALGCNLAWGIIDGLLYLMGCLAEKGKALATLRSVGATADPQQAQRLLAEALPSQLAGLIQPAELEAMRQRAKGLPEPPATARLSADEWLGGLGVCLLVFLSTFPVVLPFLLVTNSATALRLSHAVAVVMMFAAGWVFGQITGRRPWLVGMGMVVLGGLLVALTMALGG